LENPPLVRMGILVYFGMLMYLVANTCPDIAYAVRHAASSKIFTKSQ